MDNNVTFTIVHPVTNRENPVKIVLRDDKALLQIGNIHVGLADTTTAQLSISRQQMLELGSLFVAMAENTSVDNLDYQSVDELLNGFGADAEKVFYFAINKLGG